MRQQERKVAVVSEHYPNPVYPETELLHVPDIESAELSIEFVAGEAEAVITFRCKVEGCKRTTTNSFTERQLAEKLSDMVTNPVWVWEDES